MNRLTPITRIAIGLTSMSVSLVLASATLGILPDQRSLVIEKRQALAETLAMSTSFAAGLNKLDLIRTSLRETVNRQPDLLSISLRKPDGTVLLEVRPTRSGEVLHHENVANPMKVSVPIVAGKRSWGHMELSFRPVNGNGIMGYVRHPLTKLVVFLSVTSFVTFFFYMRATLKYLDPSKVVPERVRQTLDTLAEGLMIVDIRERIVHTNRAFTELVGRSGAELRGRHASQLPWRHLDENEAATYPWSRATTDIVFETGLKLGLEVENLGQRTLLVNTSSILDDDGQPRGALVSMDDVTALEASRTELRATLSKLQRSRDEIQHQNRELERLARLDPLTSCLNRRAFYAEFECVWNVAQRYGKPLSCIMIDIDHFKSVNDTFGHSVGDKVLKIISAVLLEQARDSDIVCRYGGEEFCIVLPDTDLEAALEAAERIRKTTMLADCGQVSVTSSVGVSSLCFNARDSRELLDQADAALYGAKRRGRNRVIRWDLVANDTPETIPQNRRGDTTPSSSDLESTETIPYAAVSALISALSYRDAATAAHCRRVADLCTEVSKNLMPPSESYLLEVAALMHDIGKLGVPDAILLKPEKLTEQEWEIMRGHDRIGVTITQEAFGSRTLTYLVEAHQAWYGGSPHGTSLPTGEDIPLGARILAIADAYDTMVNDAVYRPARTRQSAFEELRACAGRQFDPALVERFIEVVSTREANMTAADVSSPKAIVTSITRSIEDLARALERQNAPAVQAIAKRLRLTAEKHHAHELAKTAGQLEKLASEDGEMIELVMTADHLWDLCQSMQRRHLKASKTPSPPAHVATTDPSGAPAAMASNH